MYANGLALVLNAGLAAAFGSVFWIIAARRFHPDAIGLGAAVVSAATLAALVGKAGFDAAIIRYAPSASRQALLRLFIRAISATLGLTGLVAVGMLWVAHLGLPAFQPLLEPIFAAGFVALALGTALAWMLDAYFISAQKTGPVLTRNVAFNVVKLSVPIFIAASWGGRAIPLAWGVGLVASLLVAFALLPKTLLGHTPRGTIPKDGALGYSMRNYALNLAELLPGVLLPILVVRELGPEENARFFVAWTIAAVVFVASKAIAQSAFAALVHNSDDERSIRKGALLSAALLGPAAIILYVGAHPILGLFGSHFTASAPLLRVLALSIPFVIASNLYLTYLKARNAGWELTLLPVASLLALVIASPIALALWGIVATGLVWLIVQVMVGTYGATRLISSLRRNTHAQPRIGLRRHPHQG